MSKVKVKCCDATFTWNYRTTHDVLTNATATNYVKPIEYSFRL